MSITGSEVQAAWSTASGASCDAYLSITFRHLDGPDKGTDLTYTLVNGLPGTHSDTYTFPSGVPLSRNEAERSFAALADGPPAPDRFIRGRANPQRMADRITTDPKVLAGKPVIRGTRIPVYLILELLTAGNTRQEILKEYPQLTDEDITAAMEYASGVLRGELLDA